MRICVLLGFSFLIVSLAPAQGYRPKEGYVPDSATAVKIAEAVLVPVFGKKKIESEEPFTAKLKDGVWTVSGTLHCTDRNGAITTHCVGGAAEAKISKADARILSLVHYE